MSTTPDITLDIATPIPGAGQAGGAGYVIGRTKSGTGPAHLISIDSLAQTTAQRGSSSPSGSSLGNSGVTAGSYTSTNLTVNAQGLITAASNGTGGGSSGLFNQVLSATPTAASTGLSTWLNQGSATVTDGATGIVLKDTSHAGLSLRVRTKAAPTAPYTITALIGSMLVSSTYYPGIGWYDGTNKLHVIGPNSGTVLVGQFNTPTSYNANSATLGATPIGGLFWLQLTDDGTTVTFGYGIDGVNFLTAFSVAKASGWLGASGYSNIVFCMSSGAVDNIATLLSYKQA